MQYALQVFEYEDHTEFRTFQVDGEPWFVLSDVCRALDIKNTSDAASRLDDDEKGVAQADTPGGAQNVRIINESGLYSLILRSDKPQAKKFKKWVTSDVLPQIRRTGSYIPGRKGGTPKFIRRFNENWDRVDSGHFSIISELAVRLWGRLEQCGHIMADKAPDGAELRPDVSVGQRFPKYLAKHYPELADEYSYYLHWTPAKEFPARQYPFKVLPAYIEFIDNVWIPECAEDYFRTRDPAALPHLPNLLPAPKKPKAGMIKGPTLKRGK